MNKWMVVAAAAALSLPQAAAARWIEARSNHFIIYSEQSPDELKSFADKLERFDQVVRRLRGMNDPQLTDAGRLTIYVLPDAGSVERLIGRQNVAGAYIGRASGAVAFVHRQRNYGERAELTAQAVLFHEYLHHLMLSETDAPVPGWLTEGAAELYSTAAIDKTGAVQVGIAPQHRAYGLFRLTGLSLQEMVGATTKRFDEDQFELLYGRGWLLTHYLTFEPTRQGQLTKYLAGISAGKDALTSARDAFGDLKKLDRELGSYLKRPRLSAVKVAPQALKVGPIALRPLSEAEGAAMPVRIRSERGVNSQTAPRNAAAARKIAATYPNDPIVQSALAEAELDADNYAAALAAADRALAAKKDHPHALIIKGRALMELAAAEPAKADWKTIRGLFGRANRLDTEDAEPLMLFYQTFERQGIPPTANALEGLTYAQRLAPQDTGLRLLTVRALLAAGKLPEAKRTFAPVVNNPHRGKWSDQWVAIQAAMDKDDAAGALALMLAQDRQYQSSRDKDKDEG